MFNSNLKIKPSGMLTSIALTLVLAAQGTFLPAAAQRQLSQDDEKVIRDLGFDASTTQQILNGMKNNLPARTSRPPEGIASFIKASQSRVPTTSSPPADFPAPVFRAPGAQYTLHANMPYSSGEVSTKISALTIVTNQPASTVSNWYKAELEKSGWKGVTPGKPKLPLKYSPMTPEPISVQKQNTFCFVQINQSSNPPQTIVNINVSGN